MKTLAYFVIILLTSAICSCRSVKYVPVETVKHDSIYLSQIKKDSIYVKDSVLIIKGDTVVEYRYKYIYQHKDRTDTLYVTKTDSIHVPYPVEKELTRWQQMKLELGGWAFGIILTAALIIIGWIVYNFKKK